MVPRSVQLPQCLSVTPNIIQSEYSYKSDNCLPIFVIPFNSEAKSLCLAIAFQRSCEGFSPTCSGGFYACVSTYAFQINYPSSWRDITFWILFEYRKTDIEILGNCRRKPTAISHHTCLWGKNRRSHWSGELGTIFASMPPLRKPNWWDSWPSFFG